MSIGPGVDRGRSPEARTVCATAADVLREIERGELVPLLPRWYADAGSISLYYASRTLLPAKTRVFIDYVAEAFRREHLAERFRG